jgi:uncharacterized coiled-coil protein SlyX
MGGPKRGWGPSRKAQVTANLAFANATRLGHNKENINPFATDFAVTSLNAVISEKSKSLELELNKKKRLQMDKRNLTKKTDRLQEKVIQLNEVVTERVVTLTCLQTELKAQDVEIENLQDRLTKDKRVIDRNRKALERFPKKVEQAVNQALTIELKDHGVIPDTIRELIRELAVSVPRARINIVLHQTAETYGINLIGDISTTSISRIIVEGGVASHIQLCKELRDAKGDSVSMECF